MRSEIIRQIFLVEERDMFGELEWQTRKERINKKLTSLPLPWNIIRYCDGMDTSALQCHAVEEYPTAGGPADYALFVKGK